MHMQAMPLTLLIALLAAATTFVRADTVCSAASSPAWCFIGQSTGRNYSQTILHPVPTGAGGVPCVCYSILVDGTTAYGYYDASALTGTSGYQTCNTNYCNCASGCANPITSGVCPATGSTGPLSCRSGIIGTMPVEDGPVSSVTYTTATPGNLASMSYPAGSVCYSYTFNGTQYYSGGESPSWCTSLYSQSSYYTGLSGCNTNNCGAPTPTGPTCTNVSAATSCYAGVTGPTSVVTAAASLLGLSSPTLTATTGQLCISGSSTCTTLVASGVFTSAQCPTGQTVTVYLSQPANAEYCTNILLSMWSYGLSTLSVCTTTNCNAPSSTIYIVGAVTLDGYTVATFGTAQAASFTSAVATAAGVAANAVTVTGVTNVANVASGRHLLAAGVAVSYSIATTMAASAAVTGALAAAPPSAVALRTAGLAAVTTASATTPSATTAAPVAVVATSLPQTSSSSAATFRGPAQVVAVMMTAALLAA
jgi:hypothetical protein